MTENTVTSIRFKKEQYAKVKELADFNNVNVTSYMRQIILDHIEDEEDYNAGIKSISESNGKTYSKHEVMEQLGLTDE